MTTSELPVDGGIYHIRQGSLCLNADASTKQISMGACSGDDASWKYDAGTQSWSSVAASNNLSLSAPGNNCTATLVLDQAGAGSAKFQHDPSAGTMKKTDCSDGCVSANVNYSGYKPVLATCSADDAKQWRIQRASNASLNPLGKLLGPLLAVLVVFFIYRLIVRYERKQDVAQKLRATPIQNTLQQLAEK